MFSAGKSGILKLIFVLTLIIGLSGCSGASGGDAQTKDLPDAKVNDAEQAEDSSDTELSGEWAKVIDIINESAEFGQPVNIDFIAIIRNITSSDNNSTLTIDKVKLAKTASVEDPFYANDDTATEEISVNSDSILILVDPHNHFRPLSITDLADYLKEPGQDEIPYYFYSVDNQIKVIAEMMLP